MCGRQSPYNKEVFLLILKIEIALNELHLVSPHYFRNYEHSWELQFKQSLWFVRPVHFSE